MKNAQPRFAVDDNGDIYCYVNSKSYPAVGTLTDTHMSDTPGISKEITWDLAQVKACILAGKPIECACTAAVKGTALPKDKVAIANDEFMAHEGPQA